MMNAFALVPARSGSKGVRDKNIHRINGKALLAMAVETGANCPAVAETYVSTDSTIYERIAIEAGAKSLGMRSAELSSDKAKTADVAVDLVKQLQQHGKSFEYMVLLQPTAPVRTSADIVRMLEKLQDHPEATGVVSVSRLVEPHPHKLKKIGSDGYLQSFVEGTSSEIPRQELPPAYKLNGAIYVVRVSFMMQSGRLLNEKTLPYEMGEGVNIDSVTDLEFLEFLVRSGKLVL